MHEYALRLFPLSASLAALFLFFHLARHFLKETALIFALLLFGFNTYLVEYATTAKQYSSDVFFACLLMFAALKYFPHSLRAKTAWAISGALVSWFSMPSVFILAGVGLYFLYKEWDREGGLNLGRLLPYFGLFAVWLVGFALLFYLNLRHSISSEHLQDFHAQFFLDIGNPAKSMEVLLGLMRNITGKTALPIAFGFLSMLLGCMDLFKKDKGQFFLLFIPLACCLFAAALHRYSLIPRLVLFLFPVLILLIATGLQVMIAVLKSRKKPWRTVAYLLLSALVLLTAAGKNVLPYFWQPYIKEDGRSVLEFTAKQFEGHETLFVTVGGQAAYKFYTKHHQSPFKIKAARVLYQTDFASLPSDLKALENREFYLFDSHTFGLALANRNEAVRSAGRVSEEVKTAKAAALLKISY